MNQNTQDIMTAQCADTQFHQPDKEEIIICAARKDDIEKMRELQNAALEVLRDKKYNSETEWRADVQRFQPKFHVIYPVASLADLDALERDYRNFVQYATTFEVQFIQDDISNDIDRWIHLRAKGNVAYRRLIFSGRTPKPTSVNRLYIHVKADTVIVHHLNFMHHDPKPAISVDINDSFMADTISFNNSDQIEDQMRPLAEPLIVTASSENRPYDITVMNSSFHNNQAENILGVDPNFPHSVKNITLRRVDIQNNSGAFDISASEAAMIDHCTISQTSLPALRLGNPHTKVTIQNSQLSGYVFEYFPLPEYDNSKPKSVQRINNTVAEGTKFHGLDE